jgi:indole-3-glycerol phosphate synthase
LLQKIIEHKKKEVAEKRELIPIALLEKSVYFNTPVVSLSKYLKRPDKQGIIAEIKRKSPSKGWINKYINVEQLSIGYMQAGASALSVLTDTEFFGGKNEDLTTARNYNYCPILRKDFIVDEYQIIEAKSIGADAILLIASALEKTDLITLAKFANSLGLEILLELHGEEELDFINEHVHCVGVNNRNLSSFETKMETSFTMADKIDKQFVKVAESGINNAEIIKELKSVGYQGFLIGEYFMQHSQPEKKCAELINIL